MPRTQIPIVGGNANVAEHNFYDFRQVYPCTGNLYFVDSGVSVQGNGLSPEAAYDDLDVVIADMTASNGDVVYVMEGHAETVTAANGIDLDKAGISVIGLGRGSNKPTITLGTATTATVRVNADNVLIKNIRFVCNIDSLVKFINVNADHCTIEDCEFVTSSTKEATSFINLATTKDFLTVRRCRFEQPTDPTGTDGAADTGGIYFVDSENILIEDCIFNGFFETACIHNRTTACKYLTVRRTSTNQQLTSTGKKFVFPTGTTGVQIEYGSDPTWTDGLGYRVSKTEDGSTATSDALFTLAGKVNITLWNGEVTNALGATAKFSDYKIELTTLAGILVAAGDISSAIVGHQFTLNSDAGDTSLSTSTSAVSVAGVGDTQGKGGHLVVGSLGLVADTIKATRTAGDAGDEIKHTVYWMPLEPGAGLIDAA